MRRSANPGKTGVCLFLLSLGAALCRYATTFLMNNHLTGALLDRLTETSHLISMKHCRSLRTKLDETGRTGKE